jgi:hypothetical protein
MSLPPESCFFRPYAHFLKSADVVRRKVQIEEDRSGPRVNGLMDGVRHVSSRQRVLTYTPGHWASFVSIYQNIIYFILVFVRTNHRITDMRCRERKNILRETNNHSVRIFVGIEQRAQKNSFRSTSCYKRIFCINELDRWTKMKN